MLYQQQPNPDRGEQLFSKGKQTSTQDQVNQTPIREPTTFLTCLLSLTGPVSPKTVTVDSAGSDQVTLSWNVSASMQMTPHRYNVTTCTNTCDTLVFPYTDGSAFMNITISNLTSATEHFIEVSAFVVRPDGVTGENVTLQSNPTALQVKTGTKDLNVIYVL